MPKYSIGDKFIVEVSEIYTGKDFLPMEGELYKIKGFNSLVFDDNGLDKLQKYDEVKEKLDIVEEIKMAEYNRGLAHAWELARKIILTETDGGMNADELFEIFTGYDSAGKILKEHSCQEALAKIEAYEQEKEIKVGDVVQDTIGKKLIVIRVSEDKSIVECIGMGGYAHRYDYLSMTKTGKHIDIQQILDGIGAD